MIGKIELIIGPMFAGKSTELIRRIKRHQIAGYNSLVIKYANDTRYSKDSVSTHDKQQIKAISANNLFDVVEYLDDVHVIGIDEGQFFGDLQLTEQWANDGKLVIISALDATYLRTGFEQIQQLLPLAEDICKLQSICSICKKDASFTKRVIECDQLELIGGAEMYQPRCRHCFNK